MVPFEKDSKCSSRVLSNGATPEYVEEAPERGVATSVSTEEAPRNPSPPPDVDTLVPDKIGGTTFSKRAVLRALMHIASLVHERSISRQQKSSSGANSVSDSVRKESESERTPQKVQKEKPQTPHKTTSTSHLELKNSHFFALTSKSISFSASDLNFSPLKTAKNGFSPTNVATPERGEQQNNTSSSSLLVKPIALSTVAGVKFSPIDFSSFSVFASFKNNESFDDAAAEDVARNRITRFTDSEKNEGPSNNAVAESESNKSDRSQVAAASASCENFDPEEEFVLSDSMENEYCELVDMSIEKDVIHFLYEEKLDELLQYILFATDIPRIQELTLSILANASCVTGLCNKITNNEALIEMILALVHISSDADVLCQLFRLLANIYMYVENENLKRLTSKLVCYDVQSVISFIVENCLNKFLLKQTIEFLSILLANFENDIQDWFSNSFVVNLVNMCLKAVCDLENSGLLSGSDYMNNSNIWILTNSFNVFQSLTKNISLIVKIIDNHTKVLDLLENVARMFLMTNSDWLHELSFFIRVVVSVSFVVVFAQDELTQSAILLSCNNLNQFIRKLSLTKCDCKSSTAESLPSQDYSSVCGLANEDDCEIIQKSAKRFVSEALQLVQSHNHLLDKFTAFNGIEIEILEYPPCKE